MVTRLHNLRGHNQTKRESPSGSRSAHSRIQSDQPLRHPILNLQQTIGNRAVMRLLKRGLLGIQPKLSVGNTAGIEAPPIIDEVLNSPGQPLDPATRTFMEPR